MMSEDAPARRTRSTRCVKRVLQMISFRPGNNFLIRKDIYLTMSPFLLHKPEELLKILSTLS